MQTEIAALRLRRGVRRLAAALSKDPLKDCDEAKSRQGNCGSFQKYSEREKPALNCWFADMLSGEEKEN